MQQVGALQTSYSGADIATKLVVVVSTVSRSLNVVGNDQTDQSVGASPTASRAPGEDEGLEGPLGYRRGRRI